MVAVCPTMRCGCGVSESDPEIRYGCGVSESDLEVRYDWSERDSQKRDDNLQMRYGCGVSESDPEMGQNLLTGGYAIGVSFGERFETLGVGVKLENFLELGVKL